MFLRLFVLLFALGLVLPRPDHAVAAPPMQLCKVAFQRNLKNKAFKLLRMHVKPGASCIWAIPYQRGTTIDEIKLVEKPRTGRVTNLKRNSFVYHAPQSGKDVFILAFTGHSHTVTGGGALAFNVEVR